MEFLIVLFLAAITFFLWKIYSKGIVAEGENHKANENVAEPAEVSSRSLREDTLDEWKEAMVKNLKNFQKRTGKSIPTYDEMLGLNRDEFNTFLFLKTKPEYIEQTVMEMAEHEKRTQSLTNRFNAAVVEHGEVIRKDVHPSEMTETEWSHALLGLFDPERCLEVLRAMNNIDQAARELDPQKFDGEPTSVQSAISNKAGYDYGDALRERGEDT